jgi:hypothetical protein
VEGAVDSPEDTPYYLYAVPVSPKLLGLSFIEGGEQLLKHPSPSLA